MSQFIFVYLFPLVYIFLLIEFIFIFTTLFIFIFSIENVDVCYKMDTLMLRKKYLTRDF